MIKNEYTIIAIIPTLCRPSLQKAIDSIHQQTRQPDAIIVIYDDVPPNVSGEITLLRNQRTKNLSGAINTALYNIVKNGYSLERTFIAVLDDDDLWKRDYIKQNMSVVNEDVNWVISGLIRIDRDNLEGKKLKIPHNLDPRLFLETNPNIQGSNLFVRLDILLRAGCFDERMVTTTDRDVCFRLASLPDINVTYIDSYNVIHSAVGDDRLSSRSSNKKKRGLEYFFYKYGPIMTFDEISAFKNRAKNLFGISIKDNFNRREKMIVKLDECNDSCDNFDPKIFVGIISSRKDSIEILLRELERVKKEGLNIVSIIIVHSYDDPIIPKDYDVKIEYIAANNISMPFSIDYQEGNTSIRQKLHNVLYKKTLQAPDAVIWVLDDDIQLGFLSDRYTYVELHSQNIKKAIFDAKTRAIDIGIGMITGDPPIPPVSMVRTTLIDYYYHMISLRNGLIKDSHDLPDYYYDYSEKHTDHLEMPIWNLEKPNIIGLLRGNFSSRPVVYNKQNSEIKGVLARGGNTFIFNREVLKLPYNVSLVIQKKMSRRGDTIWSFITEKRFNYKVDRINVPVYHRRLNNNSKLSIEVMLSDMIGRAVVRTLISQYSDYKEDPYTVFKSSLDKFLNDYRVNSYRVNGLIDMLDGLDLENSESQIINLIPRYFNESTYGWLKEMVESIKREEINSFIYYLMGASSRGEKQ